MSIKVKIIALCAMFVLFLGGWAIRFSTQEGSNLKPQVELSGSETASDQNNHKEEELTLAPLESDDNVYRPQKDPNFVHPPDPPLYTSQPEEDPAPEGTATTERIDVVETIPFESMEKEDKSLPFYHRQVIQEGKNGEALSTYDVYYDANHEELGRRLVEQTILTEAIPEITEVGDQNWLSEGDNDSSNNESSPQEETSTP